MKHSALHLCPDAGLVMSHGFICSCIQLGLVVQGISLGESGLVIVKISAALSVLTSDQYCDRLF